MPYLNEEDRFKLDELSMYPVPKTAGELNYLLTKMVLLYLGKNPNYERYNAAVGALESCKLEYYRRMVAPYEDFKKDVNGDVYP